MRPLTPDDLLPLKEYAERRHEFYEALQRYLDQFRRIRVGPQLTLLFENRQTLWYRLHEVLRIARLAEPALVQRELDQYNRLLPGPERLQAALLISSITDSAAPEVAWWSSLRGQELRLCAGGCPYPATLVTCRPEDRCIGTVFWVQFTIPEEGRRLLASRRRSAHFEVIHPHYQHASLPLTDDMRESLLADLEVLNQAA
jgi:hypothetical protein